MLTLLIIFTFFKIPFAQDENAKYYNNLGVEYAEKGSFNLAIDCFKKAISIDKNYIIAYVNLAYAYLKTKNYDKAINEYNFILKKHPDSIDVYLNLAYAYLKKQKFSLANKNYKKAYELATEKEKILDKIINDYYEHEKEKEAKLKEYYALEKDLQLKQTLFSNEILQKNDIIASKEQTIQKLNEQILQLSLQNLSLSNLVNSYILTNQTLKSEYELLKETLHTNTVHILQNTVLNQSEKIKQLEIENSDYKKENEALKRDILLFDEKLSAKINEIQVVIKKAEELQGTLTKVIKENEKFKEKLVDYEKLTEREKQLSTQIKNISITNVFLKNENENLKLAKNQLDKENEKNKIELSKANSNIILLKNKLKLTKKETEEKTKFLFEQNHKISADFNRLNEKINSLENEKIIQIEEIKKLKDSIITISKKLEDTKSKLLEEQNMNKKLKEENKEVVKKLTASYEAKLKNQENIIETKERRLNEKDAIIDQFVKDKNMYLSKIDSFQTNINYLNKLKQENEILKKQNDSLNIQIAKLNSALTNKETNLLADEIAKKDNEIKLLSNKIVQLDDDLESFNNLYKELQIQLDITREVYKLFASIQETKDVDKAYLDYKKELTKITGETQIKLPEKPGIVEIYNVPVLCYHSLSGEGKYALTKEKFEAQMKYLFENKYKVISLKELVKHIEEQKPFTQKVVALTFDDGYRSIYDVAFPILKKYNFPATLFIYTDGFIDSCAAALTWKQIKEMKKYNIDVQSHSHTHPFMTALRKNERYSEYLTRIKDELILSKKILEEKIGDKIEYFAYPFGAYNKEVEKIAIAAGYKALFNVDFGTNSIYSNKYKLCRVTILPTYSLATFIAILKKLST